MGGGLMQLVAYGAQDIYLTGNPQITFWKVVYRRHTNFARESIQQTFNGTVGASNRVTATISRNGDLLAGCTLEVECGAATNVANYGHLLIDNVECLIGGQQIDKHYGHWMEVWACLTNPVNTPAGVAATANLATGAYSPFQKMAGAGGVTAAAVNYGKLFVPLQFWFCRNPGLALPLIALQYHEVKFNLTFSALLNGSSTVDLWCDYIYLDTDERRRFAQVSHEYLIEQLQYSSSATGTSHDLTLNHPVKELIWTGGDNNGIPAALAAGNYKLVLNGHDRFAERDLRYFTRQQVYDHHTGSGSVGVNDAVAVYSFALEPEEHQPSGTCNFSRIDTAQLKSPSDALNIYAVNYNVLRIMSGMGGLAYSN